MPITDTRDLSILTQVAFKGAIDLQAAGTITEDQFEESFGRLTLSLIEQVNTVLDTYGSKTPAPSGGGEAALRSEFGATDVEDNGGITVKNQQQGPLPTWLKKAAKAAGCTAVYDNRGEVQGTNKPHFKAADGTLDKNGKPMGFWPPR